MALVCVASGPIKVWDHGSLVVFLGLRTRQERILCSFPARLPRTCTLWSMGGACFDRIAVNDVRAMNFSVHAKEKPRGPTQGVPFDTHRVASGGFRLPNCCPTPTFSTFWLHGCTWEHDAYVFGHFGPVDVKHGEWHALCPVQLVTFWGGPLLAHAM